MQRINKKGFSLVELIAVVAILGITATIGAISLRHVFDWNTKAYAQKFMDSVRAVRNNCISSSSTWKLYIQQEGDRYTYTITKDDTEVEKHPMKKDVIVLKDGVTITTTPIEISFSSGTGKSIAGEGTYLFRNKSSGVEETIAINKTGSVVRK